MFNTYTNLAKPQSLGFANLQSPDQQSAFTQQVRDLWTKNTLANDQRFKNLNSSYNSANSAWLQAQRGAAKTPMNFTKGQAANINAVNAPISQLSNVANNRAQAITNYQNQQWKPIQGILDSLYQGQITPDMLMGGLLGNIGTQKAVPGAPGIKPGVNLNPMYANQLQGRSMPFTSFNNALQYVNK